MKDIKIIEPIVTIKSTLNNIFNNTIKKEIKEVSKTMKTNKEKIVNNPEEKYVRRERFVGECSRSFYVGDDITEKDIEAEFKNGMLKVEIPKKEIEKKQTEMKKIAIK